MVVGVGVDSVVVVASVDIIFLLPRIHVVVVFVDNGEPITIVEWTTTLLMLIISFK